MREGSIQQPWYQSQPGTNLQHLPSILLQSSVMFLLKTFGPFSISVCSCHISQEQHTKSFFLVYFLFCPPSGITQTADSSGKTVVLVAERHLENQSPPTDLDRKFHLKPTHGYQQARTLKRQHARAHELVITLC